MDSDKALSKQFVEFTHEHFERIRKEMSSDQESMYQRLIDAANANYRHITEMDSIDISSQQVKAALHAVAGVLCGEEDEEPDAAEVLAYLQGRLLQDLIKNSDDINTLRELVQETKAVYKI